MVLNLLAKGSPNENSSFNAVDGCNEAMLLEADWQNCERTFSLDVGCCTFDTWLIGLSTK